jgi:hypothetical protein
VAFSIEYSRMFYVCEKVLAIEAMSKNTSPWFSFGILSEGVEKEYTMFKVL